MAISFNNSLLSSESPFHEITQYLAEKYLLIPFPGDHSDKKIKRQRHGALHASSTAFHLDFVVLLYKKMHQFEESFALIEKDNELVKLWRLAAFCHDIGNEAESFQNEKAHADIYAKEMLALGFDTEKVARLASALENKEMLPEGKDILAMIIHDVDVFEILRCLRDIAKFDVRYLDIHKMGAMNKQPWVSLHFKQYYHSLMQFLNHCSEIHEQCELAPNCYLQTERYIQSFHANYIRPAYDEHQLLYPPRHLFLMDSFQDRPDKLFEEIYKVDHQIGMLHSKIGRTSPEAIDVVHNKWQNDGIYIRRIDRQKNNNYYPILKEFAVLAENLKNDPATLQYRPASDHYAAFPLADYRPEAAGFILDPEKVNAIEFFKKNVRSDRINEPNYSRTCPLGVKALGSKEKLLAKHIEQDARRRGIIPSKYGRYYGRSVLSHSEIWLLYQLDAVIGILTADTQEAAQDALVLRIECSKREPKKILPFFLYNALIGLQAVHDQHVIWRANNPSVLDTEMGYDKRLDRKLMENKIGRGHFFGKKSLIYEIAEIELVSEQPAKYLIRHVDSSRIYAYMHESGFPVLESEGRLIYDEAGYLSQVQVLYQKQLIMASDLLLFKLKDDLWEHYEIFLHHIMLDTSDNKNLICLQLMSRIDDLSRFSLYKLLGLESATNWKMQDAFRVRFVVPQDIVHIYNHLSHYRILKKLPVIFWVRLFVSKRYQIPIENTEDLEKIKLKQDLFLRTDVADKIHLLINPSLFLSIALELEKTGEQWEAPFWYKMTAGFFLQNIKEQLLGSLSMDQYIALTEALSSENADQRSKAYFLNLISLPVLKYTSHADYALKLAELYYRSLFICDEILPVESQKSFKIKTLEKYLNAPMDLLPRAKRVLGHVYYAKQFGTSDSCSKVESLRILCEKLDQRRSGDEFIEELIDTHEQCAKLEYALNLVKDGQYDTKMAAVFNLKMKTKSSMLKHSLFSFTERKTDAGPSSSMPENAANKSLSLNLLKGT